jgi:hypothetical protein
MQLVARPRHLGTAMIHHVTPCGLRTSERATSSVSRDQSGLIGGFGKASARSLLASEIGLPEGCLLVHSKDTFL